MQVSLRLGKSIVSSIIVFGLTVVTSLAATSSNLITPASPASNSPYLAESGVLGSVIAIAGVPEVYYFTTTTSCPSGFVPYVSFHFASVVSSWSNAPGDFSKRLPQDFGVCPYYVYLTSGHYRVGFLANQFHQAFADAYAINNNNQGLWVATSKNGSTGTEIIASNGGWVAMQIAGSLVTYPHNMQNIDSDNFNFYWSLYCYPNSYLSTSVVSPNQYTTNTTVDTYGLSYTYRLNSATCALSGVRPYDPSL